MGRFSRESPLHFASQFNEGQLLKKKNWLLLEQSLSFKSRPYLRKEAMRNFQMLFPLFKMVEGDRFILYWNDLAWKCTYSIIYLKNACFNEILCLATPLYLHTIIPSYSIVKFFLDERKMEINNNSKTVMIKKGWETLLAEND